MFSAAFHHLHFHGFLPFFLRLSACNPTAYLLRLLSSVQKVGGGCSVGSVEGVVRYRVCLEGKNTERGPCRCKFVFLVDAFERDRKASGNPV